MDPQANLREQAEIAARLNEFFDTAGDADLSKSLVIDIARLAELVTAYCDWIRKGGFVPTL